MTLRTAAIKCDDTIKAGDISGHERGREAPTLDSSLTCDAAAPFLRLLSQVQIEGECSGGVKSVLQVGEDHIEVIKVQLL